MKIKYVVISLMVVSLLTFSGVVTGLETTGSVSIGASPLTSPKQICVSNRELIVDGVNTLGLRDSNYAFTGEQINFNVTVRDPNGMLALGGLKVKVGTIKEVLCKPTSNIPTCDGLGSFNILTDRSYRCILTVEPLWGLSTKLNFVAYDSNFNEFEGTYQETWDFNPSISMSVTTSNGFPIVFEPAKPGEWATSTNKIVIKNTAEAGVNLWTWIAGNNTGLWDPSGAGVCPTTNVLAWHVGAEGVVRSSPPSTDTGVAFQAVSGTLSTPWTWMSVYDENAGCGLLTGCYGGKPIPTSVSYENVLTNGGTEEVQFKIHYPVPCIGSYTQGMIIIIAKAI